MTTGAMSCHVKHLWRFEGAEGVQKDKRSKLWFIDTNGAHVPIWCCGALWARGIYPRFRRSNSPCADYFRIGVGGYCEQDTRVTVLTIK